MLRRAAREPQTLFLGVDADARAMGDVSRRAARPERKGGRDNAILLVAAAEELPSQLTAIADETTVILPWGTLLSGCIDPAGAVFNGVAATAKVGGELLLLLSTQERDHVAGSLRLDDPAATQLAAAYERCGFEVVERRHAVRSDIDLYSSGWGRRLGIPERRAAWLFRIKLRSGEIGNRYQPLAGE